MSIGRTADMRKAWAGNIHGNTPGAPLLTAIALFLSATVNQVHNVRIVGRLVHEQETGLPAPW